MDIQTSEYNLTNKIKISLYERYDGTLAPLRYNGRDFIKVSFKSEDMVINQAFYRSTGIHDSGSGTENMWFPTDGIVFNGDDRLNNMVYMIPNLENEILYNNNVQNIVKRLNKIIPKNKFESKISKIGDYITVYDVYKKFKEQVKNILPDDIIKRYGLYELMVLSYILSHNVQSELIKTLQKFIPDLDLPDTSILQAEGISVDFMTVNNYISDFVSFNYINESDFIQSRNTYGKFDLVNYTKWQGDEESDPCGIIFYGSLKSHVLSKYSMVMNQVIHKYAIEIVQTSNEQDPLDVDDIIMRQRRG